MVISTNNFYGPGPASAMGLWSVNINEATLQEKRMAASGYYSSPHHDGMAQIIKQEVGDDVPDLDEDEYSPRSGMPQPWLDSMPLSVDHTYDVPPELELASGGVRSDQFTGFESKHMVDFNSGLDVQGLRSSPSVQSGTTPLAGTARTPILENIKSEDPAGCEGTITSKRAKNAAAARRSRARQTIRVQTLEAKIDSMSTDNLCLKYEVENLRGLVTRLQRKILDHGLVLEDDEQLNPDSPETKS